MSASYIYALQQVGRVLECREPINRGEKQSELRTGTVVYLGEIGSERFQHSADTVSVALSASTAGRIGAGSIQYLVI